MVLHVNKSHESESESECERFLYIFVGDEETRKEKKMSIGWSSQSLNVIA